NKREWVITEMSALIDDSVNVHVCAILSVQAWMLEPSGEKYLKTEAKKLRIIKKQVLTPAFLFGCAIKL
ncbi:hypothetical protein, partial [Aggregatibacter actinomycetemcomitans]|uniref:hypothetical protein n=1 Tax=Aggregatibacter actinomycetemcomitans TaxID=714 RepID=UPI001CA34BA1